MPHSENSLLEEIFVNHTVLLSEEIFTTFDYGIHKRYKEDIWIQKCVLASIFTNVFKFTICKIKGCSKFLLYGIIQREEETSTS